MKNLGGKTAFCPLAEDLTVHMKIILIALMSVAFSATNAGYEPGEDSMPNQGVPKGKVEKHVLNNSRIYPGTTHEYQVFFLSNPPGILQQLNKIFFINFLC